MKIGHLVIGLLVLVLGGAPLGFLPGDLWMVPVLGLLPLGFLMAFGFYGDVMDRSLGEALLGRPGDAAQDDALYRALVAGGRSASGGRSAAGFPEAQVPSPGQAGGHRCPLRRRARRARARGPLRTAA